MKRLRVYTMAVLLLSGTMVTTGQSFMDSAAFYGLDSTRYHPDDTLSFLKALRSGECIYEQVSYDGVTTQYRDDEDRLLLDRLAGTGTSVQLHDLAMQLIPHTATYLRSAFRSSNRYYSHGCIRLEKPFELGAALLGNKLDTTFLTAGLKDQQPKPLFLEKPVPVFVVYLTADIDADGKLSFYRDIYHLLK